MRVHIDEVVSTVQAVDGDAMSTPAAIRQAAALAAAMLRDGQIAERRSRQDTRITSGVAAEMEEEDGSA